MKKFELSRIMALAIALPLGMHGKVAQAAVADAVNPAFTLTELPLPVKTRTTALAFLQGGDMLITAISDPSGQKHGKMHAPNAEAVLYRVSNYRQNPAQAQFTKLADFWIEPTGINVVDGKVYVTDRDGFYEILSLTAPADLKKNRQKLVTWPQEINPTFPQVGPGWHQYVFTPVYKNGFFYAPYSGNVRPGGNSTVGPTNDFTGAFLKWSLQGQSSLEKLAGGLRSPNGAAMDASGNVFVTDNEGSWLPADPLMHMKPGKFYGHRQSQPTDTTLPPNPPNWAESLPYQPPTAWLPYASVGRSPGQPVFIKEGVYAGHLAIGNMNLPAITRVALDYVGENWQGAAFYFSKGFGNTAVSRLVYGPDDELYMGTFFNAANWGHDSPRNMFKMTHKPDVVPFDFLHLKSIQGGLELTFTEPLNPATVIPSNFFVEQVFYDREPTYGCCEKDSTLKTVSSVELSNDGKRVFLSISGLKTMDQVTYVKADVQNLAGQSPWNNEGYLTLNWQSTRVWKKDAASLFGAEGLKMHRNHFSQFAKYRVHGANQIEISNSLEGKVEYSIRDISGKRFASRVSIGGRTESFQLPGKSGIFFLELRHNGSVYTEKLAL